MPKAQAPFRRQNSTSIIQIEATYDIQHRWSAKQDNFYPFGWNQKFQIIRIWLGCPLLIRISVSYYRRILTILTHTRTTPDIYITGTIYQSPITSGRNEKRNRRMSTSIIRTTVMIYMQTHDTPSLFNRFKV